MAVSTYVAGPDTISNVPTGLLVRDVTKGVATYRPKDTPLLALIGQRADLIFQGKGVRDKMPVGKVPFSQAMNKMYEWVEEDVRPVILNTTGAVDTTTQVIPVDQSIIVQVGQHLSNQRTNEYMRIDSIPDTTHVHVIRGVGDSNVGQAILSGDVLHIASSAEVSGYCVNRTPVVGYGSLFYNYIQMTSTTWGVDDDLDYQEYYDVTNRELVEKAKALNHHLRKVARTMWFGKRDKLTDGATGKPIYSTGGILGLYKNLMTQVSLSGPITSPCQIDQISGTLFRYTDEVYVFGSNAALAVFDQFMRERVQIQVDPKRGVADGGIYGVLVRDVVTPNGIMHLVHDPMFDTDPSLQTILVGIVPETLEVKTWGKRPFLGVWEQIRTPGCYSHTGEFSSYFGMQMVTPLKNFIITGVTATCPPTAFGIY